jgi:hypothetical protein
MKLFLHIDPKTILESHTATSAPKILDEIDALADTIDANMGKEVTIPKDVLDSFKIKDSLNQDIWPNDVLNPKVRAKLIQVAMDFFKDLDLPSTVKIKDIIFTGSLANFNWSKYSDIDLHIVIDFNQFEAEPKFVEEYFYAQKSIWNQEHDITVFNYPVELYVQDVNAKLVATAVYSVGKDKWVKKPHREKFNLDKSAIKAKANTFIHKLRDIRQDYQDHQYQSVVDKTTKLKEKIKAFRNAGLEKGGEFSLENLVFKTLRRTPFMDVLDSFKAKAYDSLMSVTETLSEANTKLKASPEDTKELLFSGEGFFEFEKAKIFAKKYLGYDLTKIIGYGGNGAAYLTSKGTKLKFTFNDNEFQFAERSLGKKTSYMADYYFAEEIVEGIYVIEMEYIKPLPSKTKEALKKLFDALMHKSNDYDKTLKAKVDHIKQKIGIWGNDLFNYDNYGIKNGELATYDPVSEEALTEADGVFNQGGVILIKGAKLEDGTQKLYVTTVSNRMGLDRTKVDNTEGKRATMAVLGNPVYKLSIVDGKLKAQGVAWNSVWSMFKVLGISGNSVAVNNNKTPLHWETLKYNNIAQAVSNTSQQILRLPNIKW